MDIKNSTNKIAVILFCLMILPFFVLQVSAAEGNTTEITLVGDISRSVADEGAEQNLKNGLKLAVDLAPTGTEVTFISVDSQVRAKTEFLDVSVSANRDELKNIISSQELVGNTNLVLGLEEAVSMTGSGGRIILLADIGDNGLTGSSNYSEMVGRVQVLTEKANAKDIKIDMVLAGEVSENELAQKIVKISLNTGGTLERINSSDQFAAAVERLYFATYPYILYPISGINSMGGEQEIDIKFPTSGIMRGRIYVSATTPPNGIRATYATADLGAESNSSYAMIDLHHPEQSGLKLYLDNGISKTSKVYIIADYDLRTDITSANHEVELEGEKRQETDFTLSLINNSDGNTLLKAEDIPNFTPNIVLISPTGKEVIAETGIPAEPTDGTYLFTFYPEEFGEYSLIGTVSDGNYTIPIPKATFPVTNSLPRPTWILPTLLSVIISLLIIGSAVAFCIYRKKNDGIEYRGAVKLDEVYGFTGKLNFATILAEGGKREIKPFTFYLNQLGKKSRLSLDEIYSSSGHTDHFPGMDKIWITPGPRESIVLKNNSRAVIIANGKEYGYREKVRLFYNDKIYIVFDKDEDEIELYYNRTKPVSTSVSGSKISVSF